MTPSLILINPWIYDFAAYDLWSKPLGLLYLAAYLGRCGYKIHLIDCLDVHHPGMEVAPPMKKPRRRAYGTGKYWRQNISSPSPLKAIQRHYSRYGLSLKVFEKELKKVQTPSAILVTSLMTYWYPGVREAIRLSRSVHPGTPVILGGIYANLCHDHATRKMDADHVLTGSDPAALLQILIDRDITPPTFPPDPGPRPYPAFDLLTRIDYVCIMTSTGCPYRCGYCASHFLNPDLVQRDPLEVLEEILFWHRDFGIRDFAFYDDALLLESDTHVVELLEHILSLELDIRFHTPNALHVKNITPDIARLMYDTGFRTVRLGLETSDFSLHHDLDNKVAEGDFERAVRNLLGAGFAGHDIGAYVLMGLPGQSVNSVIDTIDFVARTGAGPYLSEYSPIPHTPLWKKAMDHSEYDLASEPLYHNNTLLPCWNNSQKREMHRMKKKALEARHKR
ncbi:MAG: radical SAM protein [Deltaproteobacteria bacterium]|nr:radical SAM protein [Deltaproteobacteria bacterium]